MTQRNTLFARRRARVRSRLKAGAKGQPRLSVYRSGKGMYAQVIDDARGVTLAAASTLDKELRDRLKNGGNTAAAAEVGKLIAKRSLEAGVGKVIFDRGAYLFHGRVKALAEAAREGGLKF